jgi:3-phosphoinositide dependent protein kinase-1
MELVNILEHLRERRVAHRDIKPENILLDSDYHLKLCDFGTAKFIKEEEEKAKDRKFGGGSTFVGTAEYVSPEVLLDKSSGFPSDLWALGCILYNFFTGKVPFKGKTDFWTFSLITSGETTYPSVLVH